MFYFHCFQILTKLSQDTTRPWVSLEEIESNLETAIRPFEENQRELHIPPGQTKPQPNDAYEDVAENEESDSTPDHTEL